MSGTNPFRHKPAPSGNANHAYAAGGSEFSTATARFSALDIDMPRSHKAKTVRIISPHASAVERDPTYRGFSPLSQIEDHSLPSRSESEEDYEHTSLIDPFDLESDDGGATSEDEKNLRQNTKGNAGPPRSNAHIMLNTPPNPFRKSSAGQVEKSDPARRMQRSDPKVPYGGTSASRPLYDVDDFKRLLLTGERNSSHVTKPPTASVHDSSSSSADTSSISRQSIFEPLAHDLQDTPRTSQELSLSDDERQKLRRNSAGTMRGARPAAPEHHHGKLAVESIPPVASLKNPRLYDKGFAFSPTSPNMNPSPTSPRTPTDLNKPLPPPPPDIIIPELEAPIPILFAENQRDTSVTDKLQFQVSRSLSLRSRTAPPVAPRNSLLRPKSHVRSPEQWISVSETLPKELGSPTVALSSSISKAPPPPPPRRPGRTRGLSASSTNSAFSTILTPLTPSSPDDALSASSKTRPPVPPARSPSISSLKRPTRIMTTPNSPSMAPPPPPPPPPPPRRRGSSQSSHPPSYPSGDFAYVGADRQRTDSGASLTLPPSEAPLAVRFEEKDVMADLSALQREVDELRQKFNN